MCNMKCSLHGKRERSATGGGGSGGGFGGGWWWLVAVLSADFNFCEQIRARFKKKNIVSAVCDKSLKYTSFF